MPAVLRARARSPTTKPAKRLDQHATSFIHVTPRATESQIAKKLNIPIERVRAERATHAKRLERWGSRIRRMLEETPNPTVEELMIRLRLTRKEALLVWKYVPTIRTSMEWERKKKKRR